MPKRLTTSLDPEVGALLLQLAGGPRKQGQYLENLIRDASVTEATISGELLLRMALARLTGLEPTADTVRQISATVIDGLPPWLRLVQRGEGHITFKYADHVYQSVEYARPARLTVTKGTPHAR